MKQIYTLWNFFNNLKLLFLLFFLMASTSVVSYAQGNPTIAKDWTALPEAEYMLDVTYRIVDCDGSGAYVLQLHLFNENTEKSEANFSLKVTDEVTGNSFDYVVSHFSIAFAAMLSAECGFDGNAKLKVDIPAGFSAEKLKVEITYH